MDSAQSPKLTPELLRAYADSALSNADDLLVEASVLLDNGHMARAYFLAVCCIEEAGKAMHAFDAQLRNLTDPAVCTRLTTALGNHAQKINYALSRWAFSSPNPRGALEKALDLIFHLTHGREPAMYSDLRTDPDRSQTPREVVRPEAARDSVRLAAGCLENAHSHLRENTPEKTTSAQDRLFTMKSRKFQDMLNTEDFWWYLISRMESGQPDLAEAILGYERDHIKTGTSFHTD